MPDAWAKGSIKGLRARGNFTVGLSWADGKLTGVKILSGSGELCRLVYGDIKYEMPTKAGKTYELTIENGQFVRR